MAGGCGETEFSYKVVGAGRCVKPCVTRGGHDGAAQVGGAGWCTCTGGASSVCVCVRVCACVCVCSRTVGRGGMALDC